MSKPSESNAPAPKVPKHREGFDKLFSEYYRRCIIIIGTHCHPESVKNFAHEFATLLDGDTFREMQFYLQEKSVRLGEFSQAVREKFLENLLSNPANKTGDGHSVSGYFVSMLTGSSGNNPATGNKHFGSEKSASETGNKHFGSENVVQLRRASVRDRRKGKHGQDGSRPPLFSWLVNH